jgi:hypothetical protein
MFRKMALLPSSGLLRWVLLIKLVSITGPTNTYNLGKNAELLVLKLAVHTVY